MEEVHVTATGPDGEVLGEWKTAEDGTHTPVEREPLPDDPMVDVPAGDPRYDGFRITELWAICVVDPEDNQETIPMITDLQYGSLPLIAADERRLETYLRPIFEDLKQADPEGKRGALRLVHMRVVDE